MPSWNIHTAHVERLLGECRAHDLGIADANAFLFGNYVPDVYLGFMVANATYRIDYCLTHHAAVNVIPVPRADRFWDDCVYRRRLKSPSGLSLTLGAWAHLVADRVYNGRFRLFIQGCNMPADDELRKRKQSDFSLFGHSLAISSLVCETPELLEAAQTFREYSILPDDVSRSIEVASAIVRENSQPCDCRSYQLLSAEWMDETFNACNSWVMAWLKGWQKLETQGRRVSAAEIRAACDLPYIELDADD